MGSRPPFPQKAKPKTNIVFLAIAISASLLIISTVVYFIYYIWHSMFHKSRTSPFDSTSPLNRLQKFNYRELKSATNNFSASNSIGKGGSGTVFRGILTDGKLVAVKLLDPNLLQSEQEFQNELKILAGIKPCPLIVSLIGYCVQKDKRLLVFEYMPNKSLQDSLFFDTDSNCGFNSSLNWGLRFGIILNVAKALSFLHLECEPPVIHGDVKPGNVLLDSEFRAKLSDFGLSRFKLEGGDLFSQELSGNLIADGNVTPPIEDTFESHGNGEVDFALALQASNSFKHSSKIHHHNAVGMPVNVNFISDGGNNKGKELSEDWNKFAPSDGDLSSLDHSKELNSSVVMVGDDISGAKQWGKDWWWRQDGSGELCSKDYVTEWIGTQISPDADIHDWDEEKGLTQEEKPSNGAENVEKQENAAQECGLVNSAQVVPKKHRKMHEWWREENLDEIRKKGRKAKRVNVPHFGLGKCFDFRQVRRVSGQEDDDTNEYGQNREFNFRIGRKKKQKQQIHSTGSPEMWSGDLFSRELSSMRGTLSYVAPEYNGFGYLMDKADIYSLGVLILVIISGRRPLHVLASPMRLEKANLISWARSLSYSGGSVFELVDERMKDEYSKEEVSLCINLALACLQKVPEMRPDIGDVVRVLRGEMEISQLPFEFSPSPPSRFFSRSRIRGNADLD